MVPVESSSAEGAEIWLAHDEARPGQSDMIEHIVRALANGGHHLAAAPTGIGKTAAALAGCIAEVRSNGSAVARLCSLLEDSHSTESLSRLPNRSMRDFRRESAESPWST